MSLIFEVIFCFFILHFTIDQKFSIGFNLGHFLVMVTHLLVFHLHFKILLSSSSGNTEIHCAWTCIFHLGTSREIILFCNTFKYWSCCIVFSTMYNLLCPRVDMELQTMTELGCLTDCITQYLETLLSFVHAGWLLQTLGIWIHRWKWLEDNIIFFCKLQYFDIHFSYCIVG